MRRASRNKKATSSRQDFYSQFGNKDSANRSSNANFDDIYGKSSGAEDAEVGKFEMGVAELDELEELTSGLTGADISSIAADRMGNRPRSMSDSTLSTLTAAFSGTEKDLDDVMSMSTVSSVSTSRSTTHSQADFDDVYKPTKKKGKKKKGGAADEFEVHNPLEFGRGSSGTKSDSGRSRPASNRASTSQAIYSVLATPGTPVEKARKLFVLEQLQQPAPPERPPSIWGSTAFDIGRPIKQRRGLLAKRQLPTYDIHDTFGALNNLKSQGMMLFPDFKSMLLTEAIELGLPSDRVSMSSQDSGGRFKKQRKSGISKATQKLESTRSALKDTEYFSVHKLIHAPKLYHGAWYTIIRMARAIAVQLKVLHGKGHSYGGLNVKSLLLDKELTLRLADTGDMIDLNSQHFKVQYRGVVPEDVTSYEILTFGQTLLELITRESNIPVKLKQLMDLEGKTVMNQPEFKTSANGKRISSGSVASNRIRDLEKAESMQTAVEEEIRDVLARQPNCPSSFKELCIQTCDASRGNRPDAVDILEWIDSILEEEGKSPLEAMAKVDASSKKKKKSKNKKDGKQVVYTESPNTLFEVLLNHSKKFHAGNSVKIVAVESIACITTADEIDDEEDDDDDLGYETDDSFQPPEITEKPSGGLEAPENKRKSKLLQFLTTSEEAGRDETFETLGSNLPTEKPVPPPLPPRKSTMPTMSNTNDDFDDTESSTVSEQQVRGRSKQRADKISSLLGPASPPPSSPQRRRSLDRGYLYARSRLNTNDPSTKKLAGKANVNRFRQVWQGKQVRWNAVKIPPAEDVAKMLEMQELIPTDMALGIVKKATAIMRKEPNLLQLKAPVNVVGDIHGQFFDLRNLFQIGGNVGTKKGKTQYLFLGDYVDRGDFSCEVLLYLFTLKIKHKDAVWLIRGNHESRSVASYFGFKEECEMKYGTQVFNACVEAFQSMPIAGVIDSIAGRFLCLHGGISPNVTSLDQFIEFDRFAEPGMNGFLCDLLWSDPVKDSHEDGHDQSLGEFLSIDYLPNPARGCSYRYGFRALVTFLATNKLVALIRAHEVQEEGYRYHFQELTGAKGIETAQVTPPVITVFSAPNYCGRYGNKAAFIRVHDKAPGKVRAKLIGGGGIRPMQLLEPVQFIAVPHPPPVRFENATAQEVVRIENACPYMPSTFFSFIKRAVELLEEDTERLKEAKQKLKSKPKPKPAPKATGDGNDEQVDEPTEANEEPPAPKPVKKKKGKNWKAAALLGLGDGVGEGSSMPTPKAVKSKKHQLYEDAAAVDGINEMNPALIAEKMERAKQKVSKAGGIRLPGITSAVKAAGRRSKRLSTNKKSSTQEKQESIGESVVQDGGVDLSALSDDGASTATNETTDAGSGLASAAFFTSKELLALQTLFLMIDHKEDGKIDADDLVAWSEEDGTAVPRNEALLCIEAVDADGDSHIGIEDYLTFAARCKERWLLNEYNNVVNDIQILKQSARSGNNSDDEIMV